MIPEMSRTQVFTLGYVEFSRLSLNSFYLEIHGNQQMFK